MNLAGAGGGAGAGVAANVFDLDAQRSLRHPGVLERPNNPEGLLSFDLRRDAPE